MIKLNKDCNSIQVTALVLLSIGALAEDGVIIPSSAVKEENNRGL